MKTSLAYGGNQLPDLVDRSLPDRQICCTSFAYLDASNLFLGGASLSAARRGMAPSAKSAAENHIFDLSFRIDFLALRRFVVGMDGARTARTVCVGSNRAGSDGAGWKAAERAGWLTEVPLRAKSGREKEVDPTITVFLLEDLLCSRANPSDVDVTLLGGDRDQLPAVKALQRHGYSVDVAAWTHTMSIELRNAARRFICLDDYLPYLTFNTPQH